MQKVQWIEKYCLEITLINYMAIAFFDLDGQGHSGKQQPLELIMYAMHVNNLNGNKGLGSSK